MNIFELNILFVILTNLIFFLNLNSIAKKIDIYDLPDKKRKIHNLAVPPIGGLIFIINIFIYFFFENYLESNILDLNLKFFIISVITIFILGIYDDKFDISYNLKLILFIIILAVYFYYDKDQLIYNLRFSTFDQSYQLDSYSFLFTILSVIIFMNAFNMYDGINGQSALYTIAIFSYLIFRDHFILLSFSIVITSIFFLYNNLKGKIFLGNGGSLIIPFIFSILIINYYNQSNFFVCEEIFILMMMPGLDMIRLFGHRILKNKNPLKADKNHFHHLLLKRFNEKKAVFFNFIMVIFPIILMIVGVNHLLIILIFILVYFYTLLKISK